MWDTNNRAQYCNLYSFQIQPFSDELPISCKNDTESDVAPCFYFS